MTTTRAFLAVSMLVAAQALTGCGDDQKASPPPPTYSVTYDGNGSTAGSVPADPSAYEAGEAVTALANTGSLVRTGHGFAGWCVNADGTGACYAEGQVFAMGAANTVLYARWAPTFAVTYDGNGSTGGTVPLDGAAYVEGATVTVLGNPGELARAGFTFAGWSVNADGSGYTFLAGQIFAMGGANVMLHARWIPVPTYTVTYNGNLNTGGSVPVDPAAYAQGGTVTVLGNAGALTKPSYTFVGWCVNADGSSPCYLPDQTLAMGGANVTLFAKWTSNPTYTVAYDGNGSTGGAVPVDGNNYEQGTTVTALGNTGDLVTTATQDGMTLVFDGWNTQADGLGTTYAAGGTFAMGAADVVLYARWSVIRAIGPSGGLVFYDKGEFTDGWRYLEAAPYDQVAQVQWYADYDSPLTGATATAVGGGEANTAAIVAVHEALPPTGAPYAAKVCDDLVIELLDGDGAVIATYDDWFLPSKDELDLMYANLKLAGLGDFSVASELVAGYWSSSEFDERHMAWYQNFFKGGQGHDLKNYTNNVRAIRAF